ncbi:hypothetical protein C1645_833726 [Glomus cerebriforme]|uniref:Uncharacterized protein n=1 Tax=Glomus cerebriforme TaxID=658196 RepID=A0A397SF72_9GLOM|nr:hypothetical protein C1645_833726 [Glomus cerebriforme]
MEENNSSNSSTNSNYPRYKNKSYDKQNPRNHNKNNYNIVNYNDDWKLFIWITSIKRIENYIYFFIIIWNYFLIFDEYIENSKNFNEETDQMKSYIEDLFTNSVINKQELEKYCSLLQDYRDYRYNDIKAMRNLVSRAFNKLEKCGLVSNQLYNLTISQKKSLRQMILNRMESFIDISSQSHIFEEKKNDLSLDNPIELRKEIESLRKQNNNLAQENSHYQASLGNMINTRLDDQDPNNATKLISDIKELQHLLEEFTIVQGPEYRINKGKSIKLFSKNKCQVDFSNSNAKLILGGILQQCIITQILKDVDSYFKATESRRNPDEMIEVEILNTTERLIKSFNHFNEKRPGKDDITQIVPTKVRQQIYAALGCRGFSNENHPFIIETAKGICKAMNDYREIIDPDILNDVESQSIEITRKIINIFYFRLKTQQIIPTYHFFQSGDEIDIHLMQGSWHEDVKKLEVEVCYFPYIIIPADSKNLSNRKILTKAQVYTRPKNTTGDDGKN